MMLPAQQRASHKHSSLGAHLKIPHLEALQQNNVGLERQFTIKRYNLAEGYDIVVPED